MNVDNIRFQQLNLATPGYLGVVLCLLVLSAVGGYCAYTMEHEGHHISGMNNQIVWGLPHVFAVSLILAASGALNGATLASVFGVSAYKPYARLSVVLAVCLLIGGLLVLVLDLGRPDRLAVAMTHYNFRSIFSWNIILYTGFIAIGVVYLSVLLERKLNRFSKTIGAVAFAWRIILTTGTGCIFGFLVGRSALDSAILAPLFIALSFVIGTAALTLVMMLVARWQQQPLSGEIVRPLSKLMRVCLLGLLYFSIVQHLTNLYVAQHHPDESFVLKGPHAFLFWLGHIGIGILLPLALLHWQKRTNDGTESSDANGLRERKSLLYVSIAALLGGMALVYLVIIGAQSRAQNLFPGKRVVASSFGDTGIATYQPSLWEWGLGIGGVSVSLLLVCFVLRILPVSAEPAS